MVFGKRGDTPKSYECSQTGLNACMKDLVECQAEIARLTKERRSKDSERIDTLENIVRRVEAERDDAKDKLAGARHELGLLGDQLRAADAENAALKKASTEVLIQFKAIMLVWQDKFAPGTAERFKTAESVLLTALSACPDHEHPGP